MTDVRVNGETVGIPEGCTVASLLDTLGMDRMRVAVEIDGVICPRAAFDSHALRGGERMEIVSFVGGG